MTVMLDRFAEFQKLKPPPEPPEVSHRAFEKAPALEAGHPDVALDKEYVLLEMDTFFKQVEAIKKWNGQIETLRTEIEKMHKQALSAANIEDSATTSQQIGMLTAKVNKIVDDNRRLLTAVETRNEELTAIAPKTSGNMRMRVDNHKQLSQQFVRVSQRFQRMQSEYRKKYEAQVIRQYKTVKPNATNEELEQLKIEVQSGEVNQTIFSMAVREDAKKEREKMKNRLDDMRAIEESIVTLSRMFMQMRDIIASQQDIVNRISYNVDQVENYVETAAENLEQAVQSQKSIQKKKIIFTLIAVVVLLILIYLAYTMLRPPMYYT